MQIERYEPPPTAELLNMARRAMSATDDVVVVPTEQDRMDLVVALAAVARCRRLLAGIVVLFDGGLEDVFGVLSRALFETWLVCMYALLGGEEAMERLVSQQDRHLKPILEILGEDRDDEGRRFPVEQMARQVSHLMKTGRLPDPQFAMEAYNVLYRWESYRNAHGGLGSVEGHVEHRADGVALLRKRPEEDANVRHRLFVAVALFVSAAQVVAIHTGLDHEVLDQLGDRVKSFDPRPER
jgi:hypothetical protein